MFLADVIADVDLLQVIYAYSIISKKIPLGNDTSVISWQELAGMVGSAL